MRGKIEKIPAKRLRALKGAGRDGAGLVLPEVVENAVAHFSRGSVGEGDGDDLAGLVDLGEQSEKPLREERGFSRAGRRAH